MLTVASQGGPAPSWRVRADKRFVKQYRQARDNAGNDFENNVESTIDRICRNPLHGQRKTGRLNGLRGQHIEHLVALWEVSPTVTSREYTDRIDEVYLVGIVHHDDYERSLVNRQPATPVREFTVVMRGEDTGHTHRVYDTPGIHVEKESWFSRGDDQCVLLHGVRDEGAIANLVARLPEGVGFSKVTRVAEGIDVGVRVRHVIGDDDTVKQRATAKTP